MELEHLRQKLSRVRSEHAANVAAASVLVKGVLVVGGAAVAGAAQFWTWPDQGGPAVSQIVGLAATAAVLLGGLYVLWTERDAATAIEVANDAIERARSVEDRIDDFDDFFDAFSRLAETYQLSLAMRGAIEQANIGNVGGIDAVIANMFRLSARAISVAAGFAQSDRWTLGIYKAAESSVDGRAELRCIASKRAIECKPEEARVWPEGVGIAGIAYANSREIVLPDLRAEGLRAVFGPRDLVRDYDADRYVSMVAVPIIVAGRSKPWGVVNATSDRAAHFSAESRPGFKTDEPIRALAAFVALAVSSNDAQERARQSAAPAVTDGSSADW